MTTRELLSETIDSARLREGSTFEGLRNEVGGKIVLFGAGRLGRKVARALRVQGIEPLAFADNNPQLNGRLVDGIPVASPADAAHRLQDDALFVVTTFLPSGGGVQARLLELKALGCRRTINFLPLAWRYDGILPHFGAELPSHILGRATDLALVEELLCDQLSRETFRRELYWRLRADFGVVSKPAPSQYFPQDILRPNPQESFVDGGAYDGDTLRSAPWQFAKILAIEPDPMNSAKLRSCNDVRVQVREVLLGRATGSARFDARGTMASSRSDTGSLEIPVAMLDELTTREQPTFIKLDVEGDELAALQGARKTLLKSQPVVAVCAYHRPEDLWTIPLFLHDALPMHRIFLRAHAWDGFELVVYAIPPERCLK